MQLITILMMLTALLCVLLPPVFMTLIIVKGRYESMGGAIRRRAAEHDEPLLMGPSRVRLLVSRTCAGAADRGHGRGRGLLALTNRRLLFRGLLGGGREIALDEVRSLGENEVFGTRWCRGRPLLIVELYDGGSLGLEMPDPKAWHRGIAQARDAPAAAQKSPPSTRGGGGHATA